MYIFYLFCKRERSIEESLRDGKELINTGMENEAVDNSSQMEIAILKRMLKVTEEQMLKYVDESNKLK